jgi:hypothetical protein
MVRFYTNWDAISPRGSPWQRVYEILQEAQTRPKGRASEAKADRTMREMARQWFFR